jgi:hypothetical protein
MDFWVVIDTERKSIIGSYYGDEADLTKPGLSFDQTKLLHKIVPDDLKNQHFIKVDENLDIILDQAGIDQAIVEQWAWLREQRDKKLAASDWTVTVSDRPMSDEKRSEWVTYRQLLRDLPSTVTDPTNVAWPTPPS